LTSIQICNQSTNLPANKQTNKNYEKQFKKNSAGMKICESGDTPLRARIAENWFEATENFTSHLPYVKY
jgi:hypothetical protein